MVVVKRVDLSFDISRPSDEIIHAIAEIISYHPGRQLEILKKIDHGVGDMLAAITPKEEIPTPIEKTEESP